MARDFWDIASLLSGEDPRAKSAIADFLWNPIVLAILAVVGIVAFYLALR
jgi:hypothetical protein